MDFEIEFDVVSQAVLRTVRKQLADCEATAALAPDRARAFADHLRLLYHTAEEQVEARRTRFEERPQELVVDEMRAMLLAVQELQPSLDWLRDGVAPPLDLGTQYYVESIAEKLVKKPAELTVLIEKDRD